MTAHVVIDSDDIHTLIGKVSSCLEPISPAEPVIIATLIFHQSLNLGLKLQQGSAPGQSSAETDQHHVITFSGLSGTECFV